MALIELVCPYCDSDNIGTDELVSSCYGIDGWDPETKDFAWNGNNEDADGPTVTAPDGSPQLHCNDCGSDFSLNEALIHLGQPTVEFPSVPEKRLTVDDLPEDARRAVESLRDLLVVYQGDVFVGQHDKLLAFETASQHLVKAFGLEG